MSAPTTINISGQPGPQTQALSSAADVLIYGGSAGGGKTFFLLLNALRHASNGKASAVTFRRTNTQIKQEGGIWDQSKELYPLVGGHAREQDISWRFPSGYSHSFGNLEFEASVQDYSSAQIGLLQFDELQTFTEKQFWFMFSRNRSTSGAKSQIRASCNPQNKGWLRRLIDWWIGRDGIAIDSRSGVIRWFFRNNGEITWGDTKQELIDKYGTIDPITGEQTCRPLSFTFIRSRLSDNTILMRQDPEYLSKLMAMDPVTRGQLLDGNWNVSSDGGTVFNRSWFEIIDRVPGTTRKSVRSWDLAATIPTPLNPDPDWTRGIRGSKTDSGIIVITDIASIRSTSAHVEKLIKQTATDDGRATKITIPQDPGSGGKSYAETLERLLSGYEVEKLRPASDKVTRAKPASAASEQGRVKLIRAPWNEDFLEEVQEFGEESLGHNDIVDSFADVIVTLEEMRGNWSQIWRKK